MKRLLTILASAMCLTACATGTTNLTLGLSDEAAKPGLLSEIPASTVFLAEVTDSRPAGETDRIGNKRNGYGMVMGAVGTSEPVTDVVSDTITKTLATNGHAVSEDQSAAAVKVEADVKRFWFDYKTGLVTVEFFGDVQVALKVIDIATGSTIFEETFKGYYSDKTGGGLSKTWTRVMDATLADLSREISLSQDLAEALESVSANAERAASVAVEPVS